ncbi:MAG: hypothetical protein ABI579_01605 [Candidatus Sumerlaeota bacterium]
MSCSSHDEESTLNKAAIAAFGSREKLTREVDRIVATSNELTEKSTTKASETLTLQSRSKIDPSPLPNRTVDLSLREFTGDHFGELLKTIEVTPRVLAATNEGEAIYNDESGIWMAFRAKPQISRVSRLMANNLALDPTGKQLLLQDEKTVVIQSGEDFKRIEVLDRCPPGRAMWTANPDELLFVMEDINFSATEKYRMHLQTNIYNLKTKKTSKTPWTPGVSYSAIGTLPASGLTWGHLLVPYQIDAMPAPLYVLNDAGLPIAPLTDPGKAADIDPSGDVDGNLAWVRTYRRGGNSGRAFYKSADAKAAPVQLTSWATERVALSPNGEYGAYIQDEDSGLHRIYLFTKADLKDKPGLSRGIEKIDQDFRDAVARVVDRLRDAFLREKPGDGLQVTEYGNILKSAPKPEQIEHMADELEEALRIEFNVELEDGSQGLAQLDAFFHEAGSYIAEEPPMILAVAGLIERRLGVRAEWVLDKDSNALSVDDPGFAQSDEMTYTAIAPFAIARERISGDLLLEKVVHDVVHDHVAPYYLVENFRDLVVQDIAQTEMAKAGSAALLASAESRLETFRGIKTNNNTLNLAMLTTSSKAHDNGLALLAASRLADSNPTSAKSLAAFASALNDAFYSDDAIHVYQQAVLLAPLDTDVRFGYADCLAGADKLDDAEREYVIIEALDASREIKDEIAGRIEMLKSLRGDSK